MDKHYLGTNAPEASIWPLVHSDYNVTVRYGDGSFVFTSTATWLALMHEKFDPGFVSTWLAGVSMNRGVLCLNHHHRFISRLEDTHLKQLQLCYSSLINEYSLQLKCIAPVLMTVLTKGAVGCMSTFIHISYSVQWKNCATTWVW